MHFFDIIVNNASDRKTRFFANHFQFLFLLTHFQSCAKRLRIFNRKFENTSGKNIWNCSIWPIKIKYGRVSAMKQWKKREYKWRRRRIDHANHNLQWKNKQTSWLLRRTDVENRTRKLKFTQNESMYQINRG